jgi:hypothetical protein
MAEDRDDLDLRFAAYRAELDAEIAEHGSLDRVRRAVRAERAYAGIPWSRIAAAVLLAGMLGGTFDFLLPDRGADGFGIDSFDVAAVDPLYAFDVERNE